MNKKITYNATDIELVTGDITEQTIDAIVNAANSALAGGGGVDGAIHAAGGPEIMAQTDRDYPHGCPTGMAVISNAGRLSARFVIHTVAPRYSPDKPNCPRQLYCAYFNSLALAAENGCKSIAFPSLGTGVYAYPLEKAASIALKAVRDFLDSHASKMNLIRFVLFDSNTYIAFEEALTNF